MARGGARKGAGRKPKGETQKATAPDVPRDVSKALGTLPKTTLDPQKSTLDLQERFGLTRREFLFVQQLLTEPGISQGDAFVQAGYRAKDKDAAQSSAAKLAGKDRIVRALQAGRMAIAERNAVTQDRVVNALSTLVFADIRQFFEKDTRTIKFPSELPDTLALAVAGIKVVTRSAGKDQVEYVHEFKLVDKPSVLSLLMRHMGMLREKDGREKAVREFTREDLAGMNDADIARALDAARVAMKLLQGAA